MAKRNNLQYAARHFSRFQNNPQGWRMASYFKNQEAQAERAYRLAKANEKNVRISIWKALYVRVIIIKEKIKAWRQKKNTKK